MLDLTAGEKFTSLILTSGQPARPAVSTDPSRAQRRPILSESGPESPKTGPIPGPLTYFAARSTQMISLSLRMYAWRLANAGIDHTTSLPNATLV